MQEPKIIESSEKPLVGICVQMSFVVDRTSELWRTFGSQIGEIQGRVSSDRYSVKIYDLNYSFSKFDPAARFQKWAAVETSGKEDLPEGFEALTIPAGMYAVFTYRGTPANAPEIYGHIFGVWLPNSEFELDLRPHFEILSESYDPLDENSEETIWIPIKDKVGGI
jgi:AraC family transcriptional regulator